jgi:hypothetical protein
MEGGDSVFGGTLDLTSMVNLNEEKASVAANLLWEKICQLFLRRGGGVQQPPSGTNSVIFIGNQGWAEPVVK